ncbi:MAG: hypothetical protein JXA42_22265, partial [Anaerolineales bacterium]|nr:hypothetical protein [Anaerolineales bacterium]
MNGTPSVLIRLLILVSILITASIACNHPAFKPEPAPPSDLDELEAALNAGVVDDRPGVLEYLGRPDAFDISIVTVDGVQVRMESWRYYQFGIRVDFSNGEAVWTMDIEPMPEGTIFAAWYDPLAFEVGMTAADASRVAAAASPAGFEPERIDLAEGGEDLAGGVALVGDQIMIGVYEDQ